MQAAGTGCTECKNELGDSRDVRVLESFGLLKIREQQNPGHGIMKVVEPLAERYYLTATICG
jgi:hypothetical protein